MTSLETGTTDQHSQVQLYREGPNDKLITFLGPAVTGMVIVETIVRISGFNTIASTGFPLLILSIVAAVGGPGIGIGTKLCDPAAAATEPQACPANPCA